MNNPEYELLVAEETLVAEAQMLLHMMMKEKGVSQAQLARMLGVSRAHVSQLFSLEPKNLSLKKVARIASILGSSVTLTDRSYFQRLRDRERRERDCIERNGWHFDESMMAHEPFLNIFSQDPANENEPLPYFSEEIEFEPNSRREKMVGEAA